MSGSWTKRSKLRNLTPKPARMGQRCNSSMPANSIEGFLSRSTEVYVLYRLKPDHINEDRLRFAGPAHNPFRPGPWQNVARPQAPDQGGESFRHGLQVGSAEGTAQTSWNWLCFQRVGMVELVGSEL
jgi:hypothetical protein